jgi:hypothetical protein
MSAVAIWIIKNPVAEFHRYITRHEVWAPGSTVQEMAAYSAVQHGTGGI